MQKSEKKRVCMKPVCERMAQVTPIIFHIDVNSAYLSWTAVEQLKNHLLSVDPQIDTLILGCTHYPLLMDKIRAFLPSGITLFSQGEHVAESLRDYLGRHPEMDRKLTKGGSCRFLTTESAEKFSEAASIFMNTPVSVSQIEL